METIVVGIDGSDAAENALRWAVEEARLRDAKVRVVHAWSYPQVSTYHEAAHVLRIPFAEEAKSLLDATVEKVDDQGIEIEKSVVEGAPAEALVEASSDAAMLVVGSRAWAGSRACSWAR